MGLRADGGRIEQDVGAGEHHGARRLRVPLVPADADADGAELGVPRLEARVAGAEVVLLLVAGPVGDVALAVDPEERAVGVGHRHAVEVVRPVALEERDRDDDAELGCELLHGEHARVLAAGCAGSNHLGSSWCRSRCPGTARAAGRPGRRRALPRGRGLRSWRCWPAMSWPYEVWMAATVIVRLVIRAAPAG